MKLTLCLTKFPGSEMIEHKGQYGVFIPLSYNGKMRASKVRGRKPNMFVELIGFKNTAGVKKYHESFVIVPPPEARDLLLESRGLEVKRDNRVGWSFQYSKKEASNPVSSSDFENLLDL